MGRGHGGRSSNDDRSDSKNPNNASHRAAMDNHANQLNPNNEQHQGAADEKHEE